MPFGVHWYGLRGVLRTVRLDGSRVGRESFEAFAYTYVGAVGVRSAPDIGKSTKTDIQKPADEGYTVLGVSFKSIGKIIVKVLPLPTSLSTCSSPLWF